MKKTVFSLLLLIATTVSVNAQLLWKISGNGLEKSSYLFGTHHIAPVSVIDSVAGLTDAIASVDKIYGEMIMSEANSPQSQQIMMGYAMAPQDSLLTQVLAPAQVDSLNTMLKRYMGPMVSANQFAQLKPAMLSTLLALMQSQAIFPNFNPQQQLDGEIQKRGAALGKEIGGFETIQDQCNALFGSSIIEQAESLMDMVRNDDKAGEMAMKLAKAYLSGDLNAMLALMEDPANGASEEWNERMINSRNANWMRIIAGLLPSASVLVAVGAGHLPGEKGLISLLRKNGYSVDPVK
ncbi:MAG: TraB/GumN family protein [Duncaniella sp.]|uniref:TraB/GumN family protein n=1 Tax=Duncaniella sp. TaxID=2518496 RepID=UPI0023BD4CCD|nr:TraB/GumN family protein [Duncaniella sp.]MDE5989240.1 TraB/GumN family protein [Duncaniella sp.]MDE6174298.1 TraB/GumN family protein [Duncaniella sp.]